jgi:hypothetical protein
MLKGTSGRTDLQWRIVNPSGTQNPTRRLFHTDHCLKCGSRPTEGIAVHECRRERLRDAEAGLYSHLLRGNAGVGQKHLRGLVADKFDMSAVLGL